MVFDWSDGWTATAMHHFLPVGHLLTARNGKDCKYWGLPVAGGAEPVACYQLVPLLLPHQRWQDHVSVGPETGLHRSADQARTFQ